MQVEMDDRFVDVAVRAPYPVGPWNRGELWEGVCGPGVSFRFAAALSKLYVNVIESLVGMEVESAVLLVADSKVVAVAVGLVDDGGRRVSGVPVGVDVDVVVVAGVVMGVVALSVASREL